MTLISMKSSPKEIAEEQKEMASPSYDASEYPYGLNICLCEESISKLGLSSLPQAGEEMMLTAKVKVSRVSSTDTEEGSDRGLSLQITDMSLDMKKDPRVVAKKMYPKNQ